MSTLQFDPQSIIDRINAYLQATLSQDLGIENVQSLVFGTNQRLVEAFAEEVSELARYDEYLTRENKWGLAQNLSSMLAMDSFFNYRPHRKVGSHGNVRVSASPTFNGNWAYPIALPKFSMFSNGDLTFAVSQDGVILLPASQFVDVPVIQGLPKVVDFVITSGMFPDGLAFAELDVNDDAIENTAYQVKVNNLICTELSSIRLAATGSDFVFTSRTKLDSSGVTFTFGNDVFGRQLHVGDTVEITYLQTKGDQGDVPSANVVTSVVSQFRDSQNTVVQLYCTNPDLIVGGETDEDIDSIRANAPLSYQAGTRAISENDYVVLIKKTGLAEFVNVWGETEFNEDNGNPPGTYVPAQENLVYVSGYTINPVTLKGDTISSANQDLIRAALSPVKGPTDIIQFVDVQFIYIVFDVQLFVSDKRYTLEQVQASVSNALLNEYSLSTMAFHQSLFFSTYYEFINSIAGVDHHQTTISFLMYFSFTSAYEFILNLNLAAIVPGSLQLWFQYNNNGNWYPFAYDVENISHDGMGVITPAVIPTSAPNVGVPGVIASPATNETFQVNGSTITYGSGALVGPGLNGAIVVTSGFSDSDYTKYALRATFQLNPNNNVDIVDALLIKRFQVLAASNPPTVNAQYME